MRMVKEGAEEETIERGAESETCITLMRTRWDDGTSVNALVDWVSRSQETIRHRITQYRETTNACASNHILHNVAVKSPRSAHRYRVPLALWALGLRDTE